jgi:hypothetical protein
MVTAAGVVWLRRRAAARVAGGGEVLGLGDVQSEEKMSWGRNRIKTIGALSPRDRDGNVGRID